MHDPTTPPSPPTVPQAEPTAPGTALQIAQMLAAGTIDTAQAGKLAKAGNLSTLAVAQALNALPAAPAAQAPIAPTAPAPTAPPPRAPGPPGAEITQAEAAKMIEWVKSDLLSGKISPEKANELLDQLSATPEQRAPDTRSAEVKQLDHQYPPARERDYLIRYYTPGQEPPVMPKEAQQFDQSARTWLSGAEFPRDLGNSLVSAISTTLQHTQTMTPEQLDTYGETEYVKLQRAYGDQLEDKLRQAGRMVEALDAKTPGLKNLLKSKGLGDNAMIASLLIQQATIYHARRGR